MQKRSLIHIIIVFLLGLYYPNTLVGKTITICPTCPISSIQEAVNTSMRFDTVVVKKGHYKAYNIKINKPLVIIGENYPKIDGELKGEIITITSDSVTIDGLYIVNVGTSYTEDYAAIRVKRSNHFVIQNVVLEKLFFGIYLEKANNGIIYHNKIIGDAVEEYNSGNGIQLWYSHNVTIEHNYIQRVRDGIYLEFSHNCKIKNNVSSNNIRYGLHFMFSNDDIYLENTFEKNGAGVAVMFSKRIKMIENTFKSNWGSASYGLLLKEINDAEIIKNNFDKNTIGINIEGSNRIKYHNNTFQNNGWAVKVRGACYSNSFTANNFLYNSFDVSYNSKINDNVFEGNYWNKYTGYDLNKDQIGDIPYRPVKLFSYIVNRTPETIILLRSLFIDIIDFSEKVSPAFTPDKLIDAHPKIKKIQW